MWVSCTKGSVAVAELHLKHHMERLHFICFPQMRGVEEGRGGLTTYVVYLPRAMQLVRCPVPGRLAVSHSAGRL